MADEIRERLLKEYEDIKKVKGIYGHGRVSAAIVGLKFEDGHTHWHYPDEESALHMFKVAMEHKGIVSSNNSRNHVNTSSDKIYKHDNFIKAPIVKNVESAGEKRKIVFKHSRALGDALMFTSGIRDFKLLFPEIDINVESNFPALWENNPYLDRSIKKDDPGVEFYRVGYPLINSANNAILSFHIAFLFDMIAIVHHNRPLPIDIGEFVAAFANGEIGDPGMWNKKKNPLACEPFISLQEKYRHFCKIFARQWADVYLTEEEKSNNMVKELYGIDKYWVVAPGGKRDCTCKMWDWRKFQKVVDYFDGRIKFVVIGRSDHLVEKLNGVLDLTDKFNENIRGLLPLVYHAEGCVSGVTFLMHLAAALPSRNGGRKPCVSIYGGREPTNFTAYCNHQILHTNGAFDCCKAGGCWQSRVHPMQKNADTNKRMCRHTVSVDGRTIQECMESISSDDVIRAISKYYEGNLYSLSPAKVGKFVPFRWPKDIPVILDDMPACAFDSSGKEINVLASLSSKGGGEQSICKIVELLRGSGWKVNFHPWESIHDNYQDIELVHHSFIGNMEAHMKSGLPLLFYANDQIGKFVDEGQGIVDKSSALIVGINYINSKLPKSQWLAKTGKLKAVIFQNNEKRAEFERDQIGFDNTKLITLFGAIDLNKYLEVCPRERKKGEPLVILKHCLGDYRKYVTKESESGGEKIHLWQKNIIKERDVKFYGRLLKSIKNIRFEFMEAHKELIEEFKDEPRMVFHKWNAMDVGDFLGCGHIYLYRTSNKWRDQYPRVVAEALAAGLPVLSEPRDGTKDRQDFGNIGFSCIDFDGFLYAIRLLQRKENYRHHMGMRAKDWARVNLDPRRWVSVIEEIILDGT